MTNFMEYNLPLISVIVPVYNVERYFSRCIESIKNQTYHNIEIILVDDGSPDNCPQMCDDYAKDDNRIKVIHQENMGSSVARNTGTDAASGEYITYVDSDDIIAPDFIMYLYNLVKKYNADIGICRLLDCKDTIENGDQKKEEYCLNGKKAIEIMLYQCEFTTSASGKLYSRKLKEYLHFPKGKCHEDLMIIYKVLFFCNQIIYGQRQLYYYMHHAGSTSHSSTFDNKYMDLKKAIDDIYEFVCLKSPDILDAAVARKFSCYTQILLVLDYSKNSLELSNEIWKWLHSHRYAMMLCKRARIKNRLGGVLVCFGKPIFLFFYKHWGRKKV